MVKLLLLGDSHCRDMDRMIPTTTPATQMYVVSVGGNTEAIMNKYMASLGAINVFDPDHIVLHSGNNEIGYHWTKNPFPKDSTQTTKTLLDAACVLRSNHPKARIVLSAAFPRLLSKSSPFTFEDLTHYNRTAQRHSKRLKNEAAKLDFDVLMNNIMWKKKADLLVKTHLFLEDGLHLTDSAKKMIVSDWIQRLKTMSLKQ
jgi:lysophospholipase L1-like esterase